MARLTVKTRAKIPTGKFALPGRRFPVHDRQHAATAKSYASRMVKRGQLTPAQKAKIDAAANRRLARAQGGPAGFDLTDQSSARRAQEFYSSPARQGLYNSPGGMSVGSGTLGLANVSGPKTPRGTPTPLAAVAPRPGAGAGPKAVNPNAPPGAPGAAPVDDGGINSLYAKFGPSRLGRAKGGSVARMKLMNGGIGDSGRTKAKMKKDRMKLASGGAIAPTAYAGEKPRPRLKGNPNYNGLADYDGSGC